MFVKTRAYGDDGKDNIQGDSGNDQLFGDGGLNTLTGGPGNDMFTCGPSGQDTITDFQPPQDKMVGACLLGSTLHQQHQHLISLYHRVTTSIQQHQR
jgi:RTX calcium-binding nonapeptide repeat (4 copies)